MNTAIYMIRHAKSPFVFGQERTRKLSKQGERDAERVTAIMNDMNIDLIVSSPYRRALQTIEGMANPRNLKVKVYEGLRERQLKGAYQLPQEEIKQAIKTSYEDIHFHLSGGESIRDVQKRAIPVIHDLLSTYQGKTIVVGTHGNVMTIIMNFFNQEYGYEFWKNTSKPDIYKLEFGGSNLLSVQKVWK